MGAARARSLALSGVLVATTLLGCVSYGSHLTATPLAPGRRELSLNADMLVVDRGLGPQPLPNPELGYRWGLGRDWDLGARVNAGSLETNARWRFAQGKVDAAFVPGVGFGFVPITNRDTGVFNAHLLGGLITHIELRPRQQLVLGARGALTYAFPFTAFRGDNYGDTLYVLSGAVLGFRFPVSARAYLFPELNVLGPYDTARDEWLFPTLQGGIALQF